MVAPVNSRQAKAKRHYQGDHVTKRHVLRAVSYTHLRAHETVLDLVCRLLLEKKKLQTMCDITPFDIYIQEAYNGTNNIFT